MNSPSTHHPSVSNLLASVVLAAAATCAGCASGFYQDAATVGAMPVTSPSVVTPLHYWESSRQVVGDYLERHPELAQVAERSRAACVRLEVRVAQQGFSYTEVQGSGFLVGGRYVLTSGHSLVGHTPSSIRVTLEDGRAFDATVVESSFAAFASTNVDLALLKVATDEDLPSLEVGAPTSGEAVIALGYPGKHGVNRAGLVVSGQAYREEPLRPLAAVAVVEDTSPVVLRPVAGSIITGGMSGSPVIDGDGRAIGILNQVSSYPDKDGVRYTYEASSSVEWSETITKLIGR